MESPNLTIRPEGKMIESQKAQIQSGVVGSSVVEIKSCERIDDLQCKGYQIIQNSGMFCFGMDAVLLANYVRFKRRGRYLDLGTGTGIIPILLAAKEYGDEALTREERLAVLDVIDRKIATDHPEIERAPAAAKSMVGARFIGIELQPACADMAARSVSLNGLDGLVRIDNGDIKEVSCNYKKASFDIVTSNPPYIKGSHGLENPDAPKNIARHEVHVTLDQVVAAARQLGGFVRMVVADVDLAAENGFDAEVLAGRVEICRAEHIAVVGDGAGGHAVILGAGAEILDADGAVQQAVLGMAMQMHKVGHGNS